MGWFGQGKDTIEWNETRDDLLFYRWPANEIKKGSKLIIRVGQKAIFYANGKVEGVFEEPGSYDIESQIVPFLSTLKGVFSLRGDSGMRAEVYFVNAKELLLPWGTRQRIMIPTPEVPSGIPVGCNGNLVVEFNDYQRFIEKVAGVKSTFSLDDISERVMGELNGIVSEAILGGERAIGFNALISIQQNNRKISKVIQEELDKELMDFGLSVADLNILSVNYPPEVQKMAEKVAAQSFVGDVGKYATVQMADSFSSPNAGGNMATVGAQMAMGAQLAQNMAQSMKSDSQQQGNVKRYICSGCGNSSAVPVKFCPECGKPMQDERATTAHDRFCPKCRKMVSGKFCSECGSQTV